MKKELLDKLISKKAFNGMNLLECTSEKETTKTFKPALLNKEFADKMSPETLKKLEPYILYEERYGEDGEVSFYIFT